MFGEDLRAPPLLGLVSEVMLLLTFLQETRADLSQLVHRFDDLARPCADALEVSCAVRVTPANVAVGRCTRQQRRVYERSAGAATSCHAASWIRSSVQRADQGDMQIDVLPVACHGATTT